jgi:putative transposase
MSQDHNHLNHATWECKYHVVFPPKYRKKVLFGQIRRHLGTVFHGRSVADTGRGR